jgi:hypothetical protein
MYIRTTEGSAQKPLRHSLGDATASSREADRRFKRVAAQVTEGLKTVADAIPYLSTTGKTTRKQELLRFMTSLLENFFPHGHGLVDARGMVLRQSKIGTVVVPMVARDGSRWPPFEYRVRLYLSDQIADHNLGGRHMTGNFSSIRLFTRALHETTPSRAALTALHEMTHMMFAMLRSLEHLRGGDTAAQLLSRESWRLLDLSGFAGHRGRLERHLRDLLRVLPIPTQVGELAASLVEEAFAYVFGVIIDEAIARSSHAKKRKRGPAILATYGFSPERLIEHYVLERNFSVTKKQLNAQAAQQIFVRMTSDVDALAAALRAHIDN